MAFLKVCIRPKKTELFIIVYIIQALIFQRLVKKAINQSVLIDMNTIYFKSEQNIVNS